MNEEPQNEIQDNENDLQNTAAEADPRIAELKARGAQLEPIVRIGHKGITPEFLAQLNKALDDHELVKIKFVALKEIKKILAPQIAELTNSLLVARVGHKAIYYREKQAQP